MSPLFETTEIKGMQLVNRFVRSATWEGMATEDGACTPRLVEVYRRLAEGQVGLIITSHAYVRKDGQAGNFQLGIDDDRLKDGFRHMVEAVHESKGKVVVQLAHAGIFTNSELSGRPPLVVSPVEQFAAASGKNLTEKGVRELAVSFGKAAKRAKDVGFDGVQLHAAHGYLMSQFLSPVFNKRTDSYGGAVENRAKALIETLGEVRAAVGKDYPVLIKLNSEDGLEGGLTLRDALKVGSMLQEAGIDAIEVSGGTLVSGRLGPSRGTKSEEREAYFRTASKAFKEALDVPIILVGGIRSPSLAEKLLAEGYADYFSMSRPLIREPELVKRWASGDRSKARCLSDNLCFGPGFEGKGVHCVTEEKEKEKKA
ncbi:MAG: NADH:flavin oxidoreductase [Deltaproteobacteria bacterium]|jgi:2,4-dienoyl-CoA reductase-like NADH-dependent reductase (Old Yellow Enzyme family)|nr:NADH:flavin oxidoreductase [Deltaproteobacteria bacterium]NTV56237.1 NADH:flavin oxidoreductase [Deltaproteobacteria bacterium]